MKGLLLKDFYMLLKHCKAYLLISVVFIGVSFAGNGNQFFIFYPCLLVGMIPTVLLSYDEGSKWTEYCKLLPCKPSQVVLSKYLTGLYAQCFVVLLISTAQIVWQIVNGNPVFWDFLSTATVILCVSLVPASLGLPFMLRFGVEKGRIAYYFIIGAVFAISYTAAMILKDGSQTIESFPWLLPLLCVAAVVIYFLSILLSIALYKKREV